MTTQCCVCSGKSTKEICNDCNKIYLRETGHWFNNQEEIKDTLPDVPAPQLRKLYREMSVAIYGG